MKLRNVSHAHASTAPVGGYGAVSFDMDGVVMNTAKLHAAAWKALFEEVLPVLSNAESQGFDIARDYRTFIDGRSREDGIRNFLAHRGIQAPEGDARDAPGTLSVLSMAARKQQVFEGILKESGAIVFPDALALLRRLFGAMVPTALVTASRNCREILAATGITDLFTAVVDGTDARNLDLPGKPDPAMFLEAARRLHVRPADAVVMEDASAGVQAGVSGGFALVVGVDRGERDGSLLANGANVVVNDLTALSMVRPMASAPWAAPDQLEEDGPRSNDGAVDEWRLAFDVFDPLHEGQRESLRTLGKGYWATRGSSPGTHADGVHYPGTYFAGVYNRTMTQLAGRVGEAEHMVNAPDWTFLPLQPVEGPLLQPGQPGKRLTLSQRSTVRCFEDT